MIKICGEAIGIRPWEQEVKKEKTENHKNDDIPIGGEER